MIKKWWLKIDFKLNLVDENLTQKWFKNDAKKSLKFGRIKLTKIDPKLTRYKIIKIDPKLLKNWFATGGSKSSKIDLGGPGPQIWNFLKFVTFLQKLSDFRPP
jgi:hypothetical protein